MIFEGMIRNLDAKKTFLMYPRFVQVFLNNQFSNLPAPLDNFPMPVLTKKFFTNMARKSAKFLGNITPLFPNMLTQPEVDEGEGDHTPDRAEGGLNIEELLSLCTNLSNRVLALETVKDAQAAEIIKLKTRIKKLEKRCKPVISHHRAWLRSISVKKKLRKKEYVSKQGRKKAKPEPTLDDSAHDMDYMETKEAVDEGRLSKETEELKLTADTEVIIEDKGSGEKGGSTEELVSTTVLETVSTARLNVDTARQEISAARPRTPPTTTSIFDDENITMAQTLIKMKEEKAKEKGVSIKDVKDSSRPAKSVLTLKPLPTIDLKDKGKGVLEELKLAKKMTKSDFDAAQIARDAEIARQVEVEWQAKAERERQREEKASKAAIAKMYDEVQVGIDVDALFTVKIQQEERERSIQLKREQKIQGLYERQKRLITDFKPMDSDDAVKDTDEAAGVQKEEVLEEPDISDEEGEVDYEVLDKRYPIVDWESKFYHSDRYGKPHDYYKVFRSNGSSRLIKTFSKMVTRFDRMDLEELYNLVMQRFATTTPEGIDLILWGSLRTMFEANVDDDLWKNQEKWILKSWNFYDDCGVHILMLEYGTEFYMLAKRRYPLTTETLVRMLALRIVAEFESETVFDLLKFIQNQIDESISHDGGEKDL
ncbi:hypothetical protein Tco_1366778 [Tanacetum coccineum]